MTKQEKMIEKDINKRIADLEYKLNTVTNKLDRQNIQNKLDRINIERSNFVNGIS